MTQAHDPHDLTNESVVGEPLLLDPPSLDPPAADTLVPSTSTGPVLSAATVETPWVPEHVETSTPTPNPVEHAAPNNASRGKLTKAAFLASAVALANKVRQTAPKKLQELRENLTAGRFVIVTEAHGRTVAVDPYRDAVAASDSAGKLPGKPTAVRLMSEDSFLATEQTATSRA